MKSNIIIAVAQIDCVMLNPDKNIEKAIIFIETAVKKKASLVILPELFDVGYNLKEINYMKYDTEYTLEQLSNVAKKYEIYVVAGVLEEIADGTKYNTMYVFRNDGRIIAKYRKINLFGDEKNVFSRGNEITTFNIDDFRFGLMNCYDIRFPEISRGLIDKNCSVFVVSSAFPLSRVLHWNILLSARAIENQVYVLASNRVGSECENTFAGNSCIIDPVGNVKSLDSMTQSCLIDMIEMDLIVNARLRLTCLDDMKKLKSINFYRG
ncbi:MAG: hypothetical protein FWE05_10400 [Defluviitaleaceae bacterium]|nr:hypothetical protein [Defluviitaleaceae bacterium]